MLTRGTRPIFRIGSRCDDPDGQVTDGLRAETTCVGYRPMLSDPGPLAEM